MEVLSYDVVESILERAPVKSLLRFRSVSKRWKSTIESKNFQERHSLIQRQQSLGPDVLFLTIEDPCFLRYYQDIPSSSSSSFSFPVDNDYINIVSSSPATSIRMHMINWHLLSNSCDGLVCFCNEYESVIINPTTRWQRSFPLSNLQKQRHHHHLGLGWSDWLGFGKDKFEGTYKSVWLYNQSPPHIEFDKKKTITTCEVFAFRSNAWRYVTCPASPYDIDRNYYPVHLEGSLHWLTKCELDIHVLSFDLHTETFQVIAKAPFDRATCHLYYQMCNLNNQFCLSHTSWPNQVIWLFDSDSKTWNHMCTIDLDITYSWFKKSTNEIKCFLGSFAHSIGPLKPVAILEEKNKKMKVLFAFDVEMCHYFVIYDGQTDSFDFAFALKSLENYWGHPICYFQSLISIL